MRPPARDEGSHAPKFQGNGEIGVERQEGEVVACGQY